MLRFSLLSLLSFILLANPSQSQNNQWPLMPEQIFAPEIPVHYSTSINSEETWSDELRVLSIAGQVYRYPPAIERIYQIGQIDENTSLIYSSQGDAEFPPRDAWVFDHASQSLQAFVTQCAGAEIYDYATDLLEMPWTISDTGEGARLCQQFTGFLSAPLPENYTWIVESFGREPMPRLSLSPDKQKLLILAQLGRDALASSMRQIELFSYDIATQTLISLGQFQGGTSLNFDEWAGNQVSIVTGETCSVCSETVYIADVNTPASLAQALIYNVEFGPAFFDNPPRYVFGIGNPNLLVACGYKVYDMTTRSMTDYELGGCRPDYGSIEGIGYYRNIPMREITECCTPAPESVPTVAITRYDAATGENRDLYTGEVEQVLWVSSDERYAILLLDNNGVIDNIPYSWNEPNYAAPYIALVDLQAGEVLASLPIYPQNISPLPYNILPVNDREFIMLDCNSVLCDNRSNTRAARLSIDAAGILHTEHLLSHSVLGVTPDFSGILYWSVAPTTLSIGASGSGISVYDIQSGESYPLVNRLEPSQYRVSVANVSTEIMTLSIAPRFSSEIDRNGVFTSGRYDVYFSGVRPSVEITVEFPALAETACLLFTAETGVNLRVLPSGAAERFGGVERGKMLIADAQAVSTVDNQVWWRLADGGWLRSDFTLEAPACANLPTIDPTAPSENLIPQLAGEIPNTACTLTVILGANLRNGAGAEFERVGSAAENTVLNAVGQALSASDLLIWYQLEDLSWIRSDFVTESADCASLPNVASD